MSDFEKVKRAVPINEALARYSRKVVKGFADECPQCGGHDCCSIDEGDNLVNCFSCGLGGSIIDLVMKVDGVDKGEALKICAEIGNVALTPPSGSGSVKEKKERSESGKEKALRLALDYYKGVRENGAGDKAVKYFLNDRGHFDETMEEMQMGWTDGGLCKALKTEGFTIADIVSYGLAVDKDKDKKPLARPRDFFWKKGMAVFPVIDHAGKVICLTVKDPEKKFTAQQMKGIKKDWFINHAALGKHGDLFIVEGQHDMASLIDAGFKNVVGTCGGPGNDQVKKVKNHCAGKTVYLWFDKDPDKDPKESKGGPAHTRILYNGLKESSIDVRIIMHPGETKDPDDFIQGILKEKDKAAARKAIKELMEMALSPLEWEIELLKLIKDTKDTIVVLKERRIPQWVNSLTSHAEREVYTEVLAKAIPLSIKGVESILEQAGSADLHSELEERFKDYKHHKARTVADYIYKWFEKNAGRFFKTSDWKAWLFYHGVIYEIGDNNSFNAIMLRLTHLGKCESPGTQVWYYLKTFCIDRGEPVDMMSWTYTCRETDTVYYNLTLPMHKIIKVTAGEEPVTIDNGTNENSVLLNSSPQIRELAYKPTTSEAEGFRALKKHLMDPMPCEPAQRYFLACWVLSTFLINYQTDRGLVQIIGSSQVGKSKVAERWSQLVYGETFIGRGTGAAAKRIATRNPIIFLDNIENQNLNQPVVDFLLFLANSAMTPKAAAGSDTDVVYQKLDSMGMITSIEPFPGKYPELINRTFPIICEGRYRMEGGYVHSECLGDILRDRPMMISAILKMIGREVLPRMKERTFWMQEINTHFPGHNKERNNEHLCTMMIILEALLKHIPVNKEHPAKKDAAMILKKWIEYQDDQAAETAITSNTLLTHIDGLQKEVCFAIRKLGQNLQYEEHRHFKKPYYYADTKVKIYEDIQYIESFYLTESYEYKGKDEDLFMTQVQRFEFIVSSKDLHTLMTRYLKGQHIPNPFANASALGARIGNDKEILVKGGWELLLGKNKQLAPYFLKNNDNYWRFSKEIKAIDW